ncbi:outer membrane lipoprotein carrier protein LolA [Aggregicoccus sp. 17bor-14]|uniref:LolA family protein n=1 Tax=Myxococcaceae TaxID=31 RepID=UPI00129D045D|nr:MULTISPECIES: outer membrane lipoprotein carrier protein LolA [Myxococcaceae]MBF5043741.1 outer membrane lipoprotein carrier protein LolA [Simulacricoccus sp. 17bor-14]MRI89497.1 outer membrane lipoprotein carrier protein LolA [Aggregicoccus sp. 17bor-14]
MIFDHAALVALAVAVAQAAAPAAKPDAGTPAAAVQKAPASKTPAAKAPAAKAPEAEAPAASAAPAAAPAAAKKTDPAVTALVDRMQAFYEKTQDFRAGFHQEYTYKTFKRKQVSSGTVTFMKPGRMRWEYTSPAPKTFVLANEKAYAYDPAAQSLTVAKLDTNQLSASVTFLFGKGKLADEFAISRADCSTCKGTLLVLDPLKAETRFRQVRLEVDPTSAQVLKSTVVDPDGSENVISFLDLKTNVGVKPEFFAINPPADTHIEDFTKAKK